TPVVQTPLVQTRAVDGSRHEITLGGRLYANVAAQLRTALDEAARARTILVDASRLESIDAVALRVFLDAVRRLRPCGGTVVFYGLTDPNRRVFARTGLERIVTIVASRDDALGAIA